MAGLVPAIHVLLRDYLEKIVPIRVCCNNQSDLPRSRPMLDIVLPLYGVPDIVKLLEVDEPLKSISFCKACDEARPMLEHSTDEIACHPDINDAVRMIGQNVNVAACHAEIQQDVDGRDKPGHDDEAGFS